MLVAIIIGGGLLGLVLGAVGRASFGSRACSTSRKVGLLCAIMVGLGIVALFHALPGQASRLPQLCCYVLSLVTGCIVTAMLKDEPEKTPVYLSKDSERKTEPISV